MELCIHGGVFMNLQYDFGEQLTKEELVFLVKQLDAGIVKKINVGCDGDYIYFYLNYSNDGDENEMV
tara:strand:+ start:953 stop:1153 length:201 start_codon:yes stop_codon:yes gene_type:complete